MMKWHLTNLKLIPISFGSQTPNREYIGKQFGKRGNTMFYDSVLLLNGIRIRSERDGI